MTENLTLNIASDGIEINNTLIKKPLSFSEVCTVLGSPTQQKDSATQYNAYEWEGDGIRCFVTPGTDSIERLDVIFINHPDSDLSAAETFRGTLNVNGKAFLDSITEEPDEFGTIETNNGEMNYEILFDDTNLNPEMLIIEGNVKEPTVAKVIEPLQPVKAEHPIIFKDFNFKLAVIQELMFGETPVLPAFSLSQFVAGYSARSIDLVREGDSPIPEVVEFFAAYEIDEAYAPLVTSLDLDGGNEIYMEIAPYFSGEEPVFDIVDFSDATSFPNLTEITNELFPLSAEQQVQLKSLGITLV